MGLKKISEKILLKKIFSQKNFQSKKFVVKKFQLKKILVKQNSWSKKNLDKIVFGNIIIFKKKFLSQKDSDMGPIFCR